MKTLVRGYIHLGAFFIALVACSVLIAKSHGEQALVANLVYSISLTGLYCASGLYHCFAWSPRKYSVMRSIDHSAIFALIAGTATPIYVLGLHDALGFRLLMWTWIIAGVGMLITIFWSKEPKWMRALLYVVLGWLAIPYWPQIKTALGMTNVHLLLAGGIGYTIGALTYALKRPNPFPGIFGYHEIFHVFVVVASGFHFYIIFDLTTALVKS
jgi:hemolysin III